jgi:CheY-like chemotaxis protein
MAAFGKETPKKLRSQTRFMTDTTLYKKRLKGFRILVVEDNPTNQEIAVAILEGAGIIPDTAINGREAVEKILRNQYDAVLMDIQMPEMNGFQATRKIRTEFSLSDLPIIAMTAHAMKGDEEKCMAAGMDGYVPKPVEQSRLFNLLWRLLKNRRPHPSADTPVSDTQTEVPVSDFESRALPDKVPGINIQEALENMRLETAVYRRILYGFRKNNLDTVESLRMALEENDTDRIADLAHKLKGGGGSIGARELESAARELENAARTHSDRSVLESLVERVNEATEVVLTSISDMEDATDTEAVKDTTSATYDDDLFIGILDELYEGLRRADPEEINRVLLRLKGFAPWKKHLEIERLIRQYDYNEAIDILTKLFNDMEKGHLEG